MCCKLNKSFCLPLSVYIRKLSDDEHPLRLRLGAGPNEKALSFVLKENETGEVNVSATSAWAQGIQTMCLLPWT